MIIHTTGYIISIWQHATANERRAIAHERYAMGVRRKQMRPLTATELAVEKRITAKRPPWWAAQDAALAQDRVWFLEQEEVCYAAPLLPI